MMIRSSSLLTAAALALSTGCAAVGAPAQVTAQEATPTSVEQVRDRAPQDEVVYFVLPDRFNNGDPGNDRGGIAGGKFDHGYDPTHKGFYHGGDLKGLTVKLDYIQGMGATAIWFAPIFKNKPVQGEEGQESSGYHGYWVTDFTSIDPHFGTNDEFKAFVDAAHARGMKVYMDIITNHTADVIQYREGYSYRSRADYPYSRRASDGAAVNSGFTDDPNAPAENWAKLTDPSYAYTPFVPEAERDVKVPAWLNDPIYYHNRGSSEWYGESSVYGDFAGLDDLFTAHPRVVEGMIEIYASWIDRFGIDGFRVDTAKHVNPEFWQKFVPAMLETAQAKGIPNFHIFGEVYIDSPVPGGLAKFTRRDGFPAVLDFSFQAAMREVVAKGQSPEIIADLLDADILYKGGEGAGTQMPTFLGNHDMGRFSMFVKQANPDEGSDIHLARVLLGHSMLMSLRGVPVIYYGDEQGFVSDGNDQLARENMFPSKVDVYNDNDLLGTDATTAGENFDPRHPLYVHIRRLASLRAASPALRYGLTRTVWTDKEPGLYAAVRHDKASGQMVLVAFNTSDTPMERNVAINPDLTSAISLYGTCAEQVSAPGALRISLPAFGTAICELNADEGQGLDG